MEFLKVKKIIPFMNYSKIFNSLSLIFFIVSVSALSIRGLNLGIEFTQGLNMTIKFEKSLRENATRKSCLLHSFRIVAKRVAWKLSAYGCLWTIKWLSSFCNYERGANSVPTLRAELFKDVCWRKP